MAQSSLPSRPQSAVLVDRACNNMHKHVHVVYMHMYMYSFVNKPIMYMYM